MSVNIFERAIQPIVDLDTDVVVYVPGYAVKGPSEPTLVTASNFTALFGDKPYVFKTNQTDGKVRKNRTYAGRPEKSWLYAKGLVDAGLTVLYHRCNPLDVGVAEAENEVKLFVGTRAAQNISTEYAVGDDSLALIVKAKHFGGYYNDIKVKFSQSQVPNGLTTVEVFDSTNKVLESSIISFDPAKANFIGNKTFSFIDFTVRFYNSSATEPTKVTEPTKPEGERPAADDHDNPKLAEWLAYDTALAAYEKYLVDYQTWLADRYEDYDGFDVLGLDSWYADKANADFAIYPFFVKMEEVEDTSTKSRATKLVQRRLAETKLVLTSDLSDEFSVSEFEELLAGSKAPYYECEDTERYQSITYLTTGGYYHDSDGLIAANLQELAYKIKAIALIEFEDEISVDNVEGYRSKLLSISSSNTAKAKSTHYIGADTFTIDGIRVVMPTGFGYLLKLGDNLSQGIPAWIPVANNPQGVVSASATTRPVSNALRSMMIVDEGISINPIIYKQNAGYTIMGNRTLFPTDGVPGPDSYLNCQLVVNAVARAARRAANELLIVSTNAATAFSKFRSTVSKTCEKMLVNGDGLAAYNITKLKKTQPGTIDVIIELTVVEGLETFNITIPYQLQLDE